jgi:hypothetical protein
MLPALTQDGSQDINKNVRSTHKSGVGRSSAAVAGRGGRGAAPARGRGRGVRGGQGRAGPRAVRAGPPRAGGGVVGEGAALRCGRRRAAARRRAP